jgi:hypothetical protein
MCNEAVIVPPNSSIACLLGTQVRLDESDCIVGLETNHKMLKFLLVGNYSRVYVCGAASRSQGSRKRCRQSGAYNDEYDAYVTADCLHTDS